MFTTRFLKSNPLSGRWPWLAALLFLLLPLLYLATMAQYPVFGDPTEYTFVAHVLGIAHPPGYPFITLMGKLLQTIVPFGSLAWRMHLLAVAAGSLLCLAIWGTVYTAVRQPNRPATLQALFAGLFAALAVGTAVNQWQHSIHANPHIITATFLLLDLFLLSKWWASNNQSAQTNDKWLYLFCMSAGLGVTHHPLTAFGFVGYALFIIWQRPSILLDWRTLLKMVGFALLGLCVWLYLPLRSSMGPPFGPDSLTSVDGFLTHVLARGLTESLPTFPMADWPSRQIVFWTLLQVQYGWSVILLALFAFVWFLHEWVGRWRRAAFVALLPPGSHSLFILYTLPVLAVYFFVIILRAQDIMAYSLAPFAVVGLWAGLGLFLLLQLGWRYAGRYRTTAVVGLFLLSALFGPGWQLARNLPDVSLRQYDAAAQYADAVFATFNGRGQGAVLLNDWEHMTPLWYAQFVEGRWPAESDVRPELVATGGENPWLEAIFKFLPGGPVYLSNFRPNAIAGTEFRLRPFADFHQVVEPGDETVPPELTAVETDPDQAVQIVGHLLPQTAVEAGDFVPLTLAMRAPAGTDDYYVPVLYVGPLRYEFTTDSHLISPQWWPNEVIVERFDFALPHNLASGQYAVAVALKNLSQDSEDETLLSLGDLQVTAQDDPIDSSQLLANFRQRIGLVSARIDGRVRAPWSEAAAPQLRPGEAVNLLLEWQSLAKAEESYTIFVHLIDAGNVPHLALDYTPLGGSSPTHLWIPKWLPGQTMLDPYRLVVPPGLAPGTYWVEVGVYEMVNGRRLHMSDADGNMAGDRYILGPLVVLP